MVRIQPMSDIHLEFKTYEIRNKNQADVLMLNGDIMLLESLIMEARKSSYEFLNIINSEFSKVIWVCGNHEFYHGNINGYISCAQDMCEKYSNIYILENDYLIFDDVAFLGTTLWTDCNKRDPITISRLPMIMSDYYHILDDFGSPIKPQTTIDKHDIALQFLNETLSELRNSGIDKVVVSTHHAPSSQSIHPKYANQHVMNGGYYSELSPLILDNPEIKLWCHGHMHSFFDYMIGNTRVVCNPRGYPKEDTGWNENLIIEI